MAPQARSDPSHGFLRRAAEIAVLAIAFKFASDVGVHLRHDALLSVIWPASGVSLGGLLLFGWRAWPGVLIGGLIVGDSDAVTGWASAGVHVGQTLTPLAAAALLTTLGFDTAMRRVRDVLQFVAVAGGTGVINASVGSMILVAAHIVPSEEWLDLFSKWWVSDAMGAVLIAPLLITWRTGGREGTTSHGTRWLELLLLLCATAIVTPLVFRSDLPLVFLIFPFVLWPALRIGQVGVSAVNAVVTGVAIWATWSGHGPFFHLPYTTSVFVLEAFNASMATTSLLLGAAVATTRGLSEANERLHTEIREQLDEVRASRARIVQATEHERRRIERNLHDGAQQRLASLSCTLGLAQAKLGSDSKAELQSTLTQASRELGAALCELRELARGIHPPVLVQGGIRAAVESLAELSPVPVKVTVPSTRYPPLLEATAYFVVCEALANVAKHARATTADVNIDQVDGRLIVQVVDNGVGGVDIRRGTGLTGLADRAAAVEGSLDIDSLQGRGTRIRADLPSG